jgi:hypothetical protein
MILPYRMITIGARTAELRQPWANHAARLHTDANEVAN